MPRNENPKNNVPTSWDALDKKEDAALTSSRSRGVSFKSFPSHPDDLSNKNKESIEAQVKGSDIPKNTQALFQAFAQAVFSELKKGGAVALMGFGSFVVGRVSTRWGRNPSTGEPLHIPERKRVSFVPDPALRYRLQTEKGI